MTATSTTLGTNPTTRLAERLRQVGAAMRTLKKAMADRWRAEMAAGQFGPDPETIVGRGTGARV